MTDYGTDISSEFIFQDGDLLLVNYENNLIQALTNRLRTSFGSLSLFYDDYGSLLHDFFGWRRNDDTLDLMKIEIENCLEREPRVINYETELSFIPKGVKIEITLIDEDDEPTELNYILTSDGLELEE